ncbi:MAG: hypothetical protein K2N96_09625 [Muribaculaceae bacterium]|nr:hypothetical protein [Muribaculaceae bacterium]
MAKYILLIIIMLVSCSRKTTQTVTADHTEQHETASLTFDQWQVLSQAAWQSQIQTHAEAVTDHIVINANGDTVSRDITRHRSVSAQKEKGSRDIKEGSSTVQTETAKEQSTACDKKQETVLKKPSLHISDLIIGIVVAVAFVWSFLAIHKALASK